ALVLVPEGQIEIDEAAAENQEADVEGKVSGAGAVVAPARTELEARDHHHHADRGHDERDACIYYPRRHTALVELAAVLRIAHDEIAKESSRPGISRPSAVARRRVGTHHTASRRLTGTRNPSAPARRDGSVGGEEARFLHELFVRVLGGLDPLLV